MTTQELLNFFVKTINATDKLSSFDFNINEDVRTAFLLISDETSLQKALERELPNNYNKFCFLESMLMSYIETKAIDLELANNLINKIENYYTKNWRKIELVKYSIDQDNLSLAEKITAEIPDEDSGPARYVAHRHILEYFAKKGDILRFKERTKPSKLGKFPRYGIEAYKYKLIEGYANTNGVAKAFGLLEDKYFEKTASISVLRCTAHKLSLDEIDSYLQVYPRVLEETESAKADLYVLHYREQRPIKIMQSDFERTLIEVLKTDKDIKCGDMRCRDGLLLDLGSSTLNRKQALECKKHIVSPSVKRELNFGIKYYDDNKKYIS
ncbi:hypothetical protein VB796_23680 [Arcicella sp. LKC2W]|uniref:hypothetical protein n=1 Tax=Arcicella sp. LKC2W TaxID=2984198 RepID=UPI002B206522|nr:hypothetical protein [Arcicella sp. LKC2W]MEA5462085.1 hypothetical protein [Arcicella sp. LKC2W]